MKDLIYADDAGSLPINPFVVVKGFILKYYIKIITLYNFYLIY